MTTKLEVRLADKTLFVDGESMKLDDSLFEAEVPKVFETEKEKALELRYRNNGEEFICNEVENIYNFLKQRGIYEEDIQVNFCPDDIPTTISLVGEFEYNSL